MQNLWVLYNVEGVLELRDDAGALIEELRLPITNTPPDFSVYGLARDLVGEYSPNPWLMYTPDISELEGTNRAFYAERDGWLVIA